MYLKFDRISTWKSYRTPQQLTPPYQCQSISLIPVAYVTNRTAAAADNAQRSFLPHPSIILRAAASDLPVSHNYFRFGQGSREVTPDGDHTNMDLRGLF